jgi:hypothetical protein
VSDNSIMNPDFKTTRFFGMKSLSKQALITILENDNNIYRNFSRFGILHSKQYDFITKITFSQDEKNCVEGSKNDYEKNQALENLNTIQTYFNSWHQKIISGVELEPLKVKFVSREDSECALYNPDRYWDYKLENKLREIFD